MSNEPRDKLRGETLVLDENHPMIVKGLKDRALRLVDEPASEDDNN